MRYEIVGGTPAAFDANGAQVIEVPTNSTAKRRSRWCHKANFPEQRKLICEVIRRGRTPGDLPRLPVGQGSTSITWTGSGTPAVPLERPERTDTATAAGGGTVLTSRVSGVCGAGSWSDRDVPIPGRKRRHGGRRQCRDFQSSCRPACVTKQVRHRPACLATRCVGNWGRSSPAWLRSVTVTYRVERDNPIELCATASAATAQDATDCVTTNVRTTQANSTSKSAAIRRPTWEIKFNMNCCINNLSDRPLTDVVIVVDFDDGLAHAAGLSPIDRNFSGIEPRGVLRQPLNFTVRREGRRCFRVTTTSAEGARDQREQCVEIAPSRTVTPPTVPTQPQSPPPRFDLPPAPSGAPDLRGQERPREFAPAAGPRPEELELRIRRLGADPGNPNFLIYVVEVWNVGEVNHRDVALSIQTPSGTRFQTSIDPGGVIPARTSPDGRQVDYEPIAELRAGDKITFQVTVAREAGQVGDFLARLTSDRLATPMMVDDRAP